MRAQRAIVSQSMLEELPMRRRVVFWLGLIVCFVPGFVGALNTPVETRLIGSEVTVLCGYIILVVMATPASVVVAQSRVPIRGWLVGLAIGGCCVLNALLILLWVAVLDTLPDGRRLPVPVTVLSTAAGLVVLTLIAGSMIGLVLSIGLGYDFSALAGQTTPLRQRGRWSALRAAVLKRRGRMYVIVIAILCFAAVIGGGREEASGHGALPFRGVGFQVLNGVIYGLAVGALFVGTWGVNRWGLARRVELHSFIESVGLRLRPVRGPLLAFLILYALSVSGFASLYSLASVGTQQAFMNQWTHQVATRQDTSIANLVFFCVTLLPGTSLSPLLPWSLLARTIATIQLVVNLAWTGGILLTAIQDAATSRPGIVQSPMTTTAQPAVAITQIIVRHQVVVTSGGARTAAIATASSRTPRRGRLNIPHRARSLFKRARYSLGL